jgi:hypothetical protein
MTPITESKVPDHQKEWHRPQLRKLPIAATASSNKTGAINNSDGTGNPKTADANGQFS